MTQTKKLFTTIWKSWQNSSITTLRWLDPKKDQEFVDVDMPDSNVGAIDSTRDMSILVYEDQRLEDLLIFLIKAHAVLNQKDRGQYRRPLDQRLVLIATEEDYDAVVVLNQAWCGGVMSDFSEWLQWHNSSKKYQYIESKFELVTSYVQCTLIDLALKNRGHVN